MRLPRPGQDVIVWWLDSGASENAGPGGHRPVGLWVKKTHGTVLSCQEDSELEKAAQKSFPGLRLPRGTDTRTLVLAMCSGGHRDAGSELGAIWVPAIVKLKVVT